MKLTLEPPVTSEIPVSLELIQECDGDVVLYAKKGNLSVLLLRVVVGKGHGENGKGYIARIIGQSAKLVDLGFCVDEHGVIKST